MEKINEFIKKYLISILLSVGFLMPLAVTVLTSWWPNPIEGFIVDNDWIGFFGSYMGAILGGLVTLIVMERTIKAGDRNVKETITDNYNIENRREKREFCDDIVTLVSSYCSQSREYRAVAKSMSQFSQDYINSRKEFLSLKSKLHRSDSRLVSQDDILILELCEMRYKDDKISYNKSLEHMDRINLLPIYFELSIKLERVNEAKSLIEKINKVNELRGKDTRESDLDKIKISDNDFNNAEKELIGECRNFIEIYLR